MMEEDESLITCPACGDSFAPAEAALQQCPHCGEQFFVETGTEESEDDLAARDALERRRTEEKEGLDDRHIKVVQLEKRSLYRSRSWMLVIAFLMLGIAGQLVWRGVVQLSYDTTRAVAYFVLALGLIGFSIRFLQRARRYLREAQAIKLPDPTTPPDFSTLSDGSQIVDHLHSMSSDDENAAKR